MKKESKTTKKTAKSAAAAKAPRKATKRSTVVKTAPKTTVVKKTPVVKQSIQDTPAWVTAVAIVLIILGYAVYRFWGVAKIDNVTISRLDYYNAMERQVGAQVLDSLIEETLILQAAKAQNYVADQKAIDDQIATVSAQIIAQGSTIEDALKAENLTLDQVRRMYEINLIAKDLGSGDTAVTDAEIDAYITENKANLPTTLTTEEIRSMVKTQLENQKANQNIAAWIETLKSSAEIIRY